MSPKLRQHLLRFAPRVGVSILLVFIGVAGIAFAVSRKKPPAEIEMSENAIRVEAMRARPENLTPTITAHGEVKSLVTVPVAPEVAGRVTYVHPGLEVGGIIDKGETLFRVDRRDYDAVAQETGAAVQQLKARIEGLRRQQSVDDARLKNARRNAELAKRQLKRVRDLLDNHKIGTAETLERSEQACNVTTDVAEQLAGAVSLYPSRIAEAEAASKAAQARATRALTNVSRCEVKAPFRARIKSVSIEAGQYVRPGQVLMQLSNDTTIEIRVPLDSRDLQSNLRFEGSARGAWFPRLKPVDCSVQWTESSSKTSWTGRLDRVVSFNPKTRMVTVAVRVDNEQHGLPLVEGMFCRVEIPGTRLEDVYRIPRWAVTQHDEVYVARNDRLHIVPVKIALVDGTHALISEGINANDNIIITRLMKPQHNTRVDVTTINATGGRQ